MKWTPAEAKLLKDARIAGMSYASIGVLLNRTEVSVWAKADRMGLPVPRPL